MKLFISVVNHNHDKIICENSTLKNLAKEHTVILKSNTPATSELQAYCNNNNIILIQRDEIKGFGANNNDIFNIAKIKFKMNKQDYFLVLNPDIKISTEVISQLLIQLKNTYSDISAINLFLDSTMTQYDHSIRHYPALLNPLKTLLNIPRQDLYDKNEIDHPIKIDWAAGSFLLFRAECYESLNGFDEKYFMYFEDADICTRANLAGLQVTYFPDIKAVHFASHQNRKLFSKHFIWYWISSFRYHLRFLKKPLSN
jgi:N-acetylglucosaminyl-diphospho-decaprenol L-rhamnosyltransferase